MARRDFPISSIIVEQNELIMFPALILRSITFSTISSENKQGRRRKSIDTNLLEVI